MSSKYTPHCVTCCVPVSVIARVSEATDVNNTASTYVDIYGVCEFNNVLSLVQRSWSCTKSFWTWYLTNRLREFLQINKIGTKMNWLDSEITMRRTTISFPYSSLRRKHFDQEEFSAYDGIWKFLLGVCIVLLYFISPFQCICWELKTSYVTMYFLLSTIFTNIRVDSIQGNRKREKEINSLHSSTKNHNLQQYQQYLYACWCHGLHLPDLNKK